MAENAIRLNVHADGIGLRKVFGDFARLHRGPRPEYDLPDASIPLGSERSNPALKLLREGERVLVVEWGELRAEATVVSHESHGTRWWHAYELGEIEDDVPVTEPADTISSLMAR